MRPSVNALFLCACLVVDPVAALPIPPSMRPSHFGAWRASHVTLQELAFLIIFVSALLFSVIGASLLTIFSRARSQAFVDGFSLGATSSCPFRRLCALPPPFTTAPSGGQGASRRTRVAMRSRVAYPMAAGRRWYQAQRQSHRISAA